MKTSIKTVGAVCGLALVTLVTGCGAAEEEFDAQEFASEEELGSFEEVNELGEALGEAECRNAAATVTATGAIEFTSVTTYNDPGCTKAKVVQLTNPIRNAFVAWNDSWPSTEAACENAFIRAIVYEKNGANFTKILDETRNGNFGTGLVTCDIPAINATLSSNKIYKFAVTARNSSGQTRKVRVATMPVVR